jgi:hypothetical protein
LTKSEYNKKLHDPRWQKKRLKILERDGFKCKWKGCTNETSELHVHHLRYFKGDPWDIPDKYLITYCDKHHKLAHAKR